jgi:atypical dual specificity phosphatase
MPRRFSWVLPDELAVGSFPHDASIYKLDRSGITAVLTLTEDFEAQMPPEMAHNFVWHRIPMPDGYTGGIPDVSHFQAGVQVIEFWRQRNNTVYVHCLAGIGRSASMCVAYVAKSKGLPFEEALELVKKAHPDAAPDPEQQRVIQEYLKLCGLS